MIMAVHFEAETAYSMIEYQDDHCLRKIAEKVKKEKHGLEWNEGYTSWDSDSDGNVILGIWGKDDNRLDKIIYDRKALAKALKAVGYENPESWGAENDYVCQCGSHELRYVEYDNPEGNGFFCMNCGLSPCGIRDTDNKPCTCDLDEFFHRSKSYDAEETFETDWERGQHDPTLM